MLGLEGVDSMLTVRDDQSEGLNTIQGFHRAPIGSEERAVSPLRSSPR